MHYRVRETQGQIQLVALSLRLVTHAYQVQLFLETLGDANNHVVDQCAQRAGHGIGFAAVVRHVETQGSCIVFHFDLAGEGLGKYAQRAFYGDRLCGDGDFGASWHYDRHFSYSRHV
ncbi:hypothetical protein D3C72_1597070 [compost metagenome]